MLKSVPILMNGPSLPLISERLAEEFAAIRPWLTEDPAATLREAREKVRGIASNAGRGRIDADYMDAFPNLEIIAHYGVGYDTVDTAAAAARGIVLTNTPDVLTDDVADLALGLLLAAARAIPIADRFVREDKWEAERFPFVPSLGGRKVGIVGLGRIGKAIARRCEGFGLDVHYYGRKRQYDIPYPYHSDLVSLATATEILFLSLPGEASTRNLVDEEVLKALGPRGVLINVARGSVVDEAALLAALRDGTIHAAGLDVFHNEPRIRDDFRKMPNVVLTPHIGSATRETRAAMGNLVVDNLRHWFLEGKALTPVVVDETR